eukprot:scaffold7294_cov93-Cylindrotheca_fusiformis.AAC.8
MKQHRIRTHQELEATMTKRGSEHQSKENQRPARDSVQAEGKELVGRDIQLREYLEDLRCTPRVSSLEYSTSTANTEEPDGDHGYDEEKCDEILDDCSTGSIDSVELTAARLPHLLHHPQRFPRRPALTRMLKERKGRRRRLHGSKLPHEEKKSPLNRRLLRTKDSFMMAKEQRRRHEENEGKQGLRRSKRDFQPEDDLTLTPPVQRPIKEELFFQGSQGHRKNMSLPNCLLYTPNSSMPTAADSGLYCKAPSLTHNPQSLASLRGALIRSFS